MRKHALRNAEGEMQQEVQRAWLALGPKRYAITGRPPVSLLTAPVSWMLCTWSPCTSAACSLMMYFSLRPHTAACISPCPAGAPSLDHRPRYPLADAMSSALAQPSLHLAAKVIASSVLHLLHGYAQAAHAAHHGCASCKSALQGPLQSPSGCPDASEGHSLARICHVKYRAAVLRCCRRCPLPLVCLRVDALEGGSPVRREIVQCVACVLDVIGAPPRVLRVVLGRVIKGLLCSEEPHATTFMRAPCMLNLLKDKRHKPVQDMLAASSTLHPWQMNSHISRS